jgi:hypothetical protein
MSSTRPIYPEPEHFPEVATATPVAVAAPVAPVSAAPVAVAAPPAPVPHVEHSYTPEVFVCTRCGSNNIAIGSVIDFNGHHFEQIRFAPKRVTLRFLNSLLALRPQRSLLSIRAEACRDCGAVLLTVDPEELRRLERRR